MKDIRNALNNDVSIFNNGNNINYYSDYYIWSNNISYEIELNIVYENKKLYRLSLVVRDDINIDDVNVLNITFYKISDIISFCQNLILNVNRIKSDIKTSSNKYLTGDVILKSLIYK